MRFFLGLFDGAKFPNMMGWFDKCKAAIPNYEKIDGEGAAQLGGLYKWKVSTESEIKIKSEPIGVTEGNMETYPVNEERDKVVSLIWVFENNGRRL